ncbi:hypothetical protein FP828_01485 [bacterium]|nr:hypothetical protein [bacterium]
MKTLLFLIIAGAAMYFSKSVSVKPYVPESAVKLGAAIGELKNKTRGLSPEQKKSLEDIAHAREGGGPSSEEYQIMGDIKKTMSMERKAPVIEKLNSIFAPAAVLLASSAAALKLYDSNFPVYSRLMGSFFLPGLSFLLIASGV